MKRFLHLLIALLMLGSCNTKNKRKEQETILDNISYIEESIHYQIDSLPRLCDVLKMKKQFIDIGNCKLYCETEGKGITMVVIHGGPGGTHHYFHPWFSEAAKYCQVIYYDQRGCGQSDFNPGKNGYSFEQAINDLDLLRQKLKINKWIVCGYSYGGAIAQFYTATHPENVSGMVLINSSPVLNDSVLSSTRQYDYISDEESLKIKEIYKLYGNQQITFQQLLYNKGINGDWKRQNFYKPTHDESIRALLYEWVNDRGFNSTMSESLSKYDLKHKFDDCPVPTLICEGQWDLTWSSEKKNLLRNNHPNAEFVLFKHSGHNIFYDESDLFFSALKKYIENMKPPSNNEIQQWKRQASKIIDS